MTSILLTHEESGKVKSGRKVKIERQILMQELSVVLPHAVQSEGVLWVAGFGKRVDAGTHLVTMNDYGAVMTSTGLGLKPGEFAFVCPFINGQTKVNTDRKSLRRWVIESNDDTGDVTAVHPNGEVTTIAVIRVHVKSTEPRNSPVSWFWEIEAVVMP